MISIEAGAWLGVADPGTTPAGKPAARRPTTVAERFADLLMLRPPAVARVAAIGLAAQGVSAREVYLDVLGPAMLEIGARWQRGIASIGQEHLATAVVDSIMARLAGQLGTNPPVRRRIVLACTDGELHETGLRMVRDFLEGDGWEVFYLGAETPSDSLQLLVDRAQPDVVGLSTTLPNRIPVARATVAALRSRPAPPFILLGGHAYGGDAALARRIGADAFAANAGEASRLLRCGFGDATVRTASEAAAAGDVTVPSPC
jgi:MerR family transcriptional regulator, light-induced transcriptional regulator